MVRLRQNMSSVLGLLMFILIIVGATAAYISYKNPDTRSILFWSMVGAVAIFLIGVLFFGGINLPKPRPTSQYMNVITVLHTI